MAASVESSSSPAGSANCKLGLSPTGSDHVDLILNHVQNELKRLIQQRSVIRKRIAVTERTIIGLSAIFGNDILSDELARLINDVPTKRLSRTGNSEVMVMANRWVVPPGVSW